MELGGAQDCYQGLKKCGVAFRCGRTFLFFVETYFYLQDCQEILCTCAWKRRLVACVYIPIAVHVLDMMQQEIFSTSRVIPAIWYRPI